MMLTMKRAKAWRQNTTKFKTIMMTSWKTGWTASLTTWARKCLIHSDVVVDLAVGAFADVVVVVAALSNASGCQEDVVRRTVACTVVSSCKTSSNWGSSPPPPKKKNKKSKLKKRLTKEWMKDNAVNKYHK